jgi:hypothetical protein
MSFSKTFSRCYQISRLKDVFLEYIRETRAIWVFGTNPLSSVLVKYGDQLSGRFEKFACARILQFIPGSIPPKNAKTI